jgi:hypothetical protein
MPRPGSHVPIEFAPTDRVDADPQLRDEFIQQVLGFGPEDPVFISDQSSICDFGDDDRILEIRNRIKEVYGIEITKPEPVYLADLFDTIRLSTDA